MNTEGIARLALYMAINRCWGFAAQLQLSSLYRYIDIYLVDYSNNRIETLLFVFAIMNRIHSEVTGYSIRLLAKNRVNE